MSTRETVNALLSDLASQLNLSFLKLNENGICAFENPEGVKFLIEAPEHGALVFIASPMQFMPKLNDQRRELQQHLLEGNFYFHNNLGAVFSLDTREDRIYLQYSFPVAFLDKDLFGNILNNFITYATHSYKELQDNFFAETAAPEHKPPMFYQRF
ncbi:CesT family type III secretion system chaperone [Hahella sp. NBU794]|uniref:CesT family type III secretion system chaperone n=1 Tax=Hahella sp. NBU794 TaxID=3422590 RepID=UPI003D6DBFB0